MWNQHGNPETKQSPCNGNMMAHPLPKNSELHHLLERSWPWFFRIWMEFWLWTKKTTITCDAYVAVLQNLRETVKKNERR
jgi:hypothetical protein